jgi:hypothetical protein
VTMDDLVPAPLMVDLWHLDVEGHGRF